MHNIVVLRIITYLLSILFFTIHHLILPLIKKGDLRLNPLAHGIHLSFYVSTSFLSVKCWERKILSNIWKSQVTDNFPKWKNSNWGENFKVFFLYSCHFHIFLRLGMKEQTPLEISSLLVNDVPSPSSS